MAGARGLTIGEAAACLAVEYPGVTVAVLRRLESAGKFTAGRTASGYRRYSDTDLDLIRVLLASGLEGQGAAEGAADGYSAQDLGRPARYSTADRADRPASPDPSDLSGAESPLTHPAVGATGVAPGMPLAAAIAAQRPVGARTAARAGRGASSRIPAARTAGAGRTQAPAIATLFEVAADPAQTAHPQGAHAQAPAAPAPRPGRAASRVADLAPCEVSQPPEPVGAARTVAPPASLRASAAPGQVAPAPSSPPRRADRRWPDAEFFTPDLGEVALDRDQLAAAARTDRAWVEGLVEYGLLPGTESAGGADLLVARASAELAQFGVEPRHLRAVAASAARVAELIAAATTAGTSRDPARRERAVLAASGRSAEAAAAAVRLHAALVRAALLRS